MSVHFDGVEFRRDVLAVIDGKQDFRLINRLLDEHLAAGVPTGQLIDELSVLMLDLRAQDREDDEEMVANGIDVLTGW
jgi:hypothetical protein